MFVSSLIATACLVTLAILHSYLGERRLLGPLLASPDFPKLPLGAKFSKATLRFAWHLTSLAWLAFAYLLATGGCAPWPVAILLAVSGIVTHVATRGRHAAWAVFMLGAVATAWTATDPRAWTEAVAVLGAAVLAAIGGMHVAWAFGLRWGSVAALPEHRGAPVFVPGRTSTLAVAGGLFTAAWLLLALARLAPAPLPTAWLWTGGLVAASVFGLRTIGDGRFVGLSKRVVGTRFARADDAVFTPLCFALCTTIALQLLGR